MSWISIFSGNFPSFLSSMFKGNFRFSTACQRDKIWVRRQGREGMIVYIMGRYTAYWGEHGNALQYHRLEKPMDRGAWRATVHGVTKNQTRLQWLSTAYILSVEFSTNDRVSSGLDSLPIFSCESECSMLFCSPLLLSSSSAFLYPLAFCIAWHLPPVQARKNQNILIFSSPSLAMSSPVIKSSPLMTL